MAPDWFNYNSCMNNAEMMRKEAQLITDSQDDWINFQQHFVSLVTFWFFTADLAIWRFKRSSKNFISLHHRVWSEPRKQASRLVFRSSFCLPSQVFFLWLHWEDDTFYNLCSQAFTHFSCFTTKQLLCLVWRAAKVRDVKMGIIYLSIKDIGK